MRCILIRTQNVCVCVLIERCWIFVIRKVFVDVDLDVVRHKIDAVGSTIQSFFCCSEGCIVVFDPRFYFWKSFFFRRDLCPWSGVVVNALVLQWKRLWENSRIKGFLMDCSQLSKFDVENHFVKTKLNKEQIIENEIFRILVRSGLSLSGNHRVLQNTSPHWYFRSQSTGAAWRHWSIARHRQLWKPDGLLRPTWPPLKKWLYQISAEGCWHTLITRGRRYWFRKRVLTHFASWVVALKQIINWLGVIVDGYARRQASKRLLEFKWRDCFAHSEIWNQACAKVS